MSDPFDPGYGGGPLPPRPTVTVGPPQVNFDPNAPAGAKFAVSQCGPNYTWSGGQCVPSTVQGPPPGTVYPGGPPNVQPGNRVNNPGGTDTIFADVVTTIAGAGIGGILGGGGGASVGGQIAGALVSGAVAPLIQNIIGGQGTDLSALLRNIPSYLGAVPFFGQDFIADVPAQPFDPGGFGGGVLTAGPYLGASGPLVGDLLRRGKIKLDDLLTGKGRNVTSALASVLNSRRLLELVG